VSITPLNLKKKEHVYKLSGGLQITLTERTRKLNPDEEEQLGLLSRVGAHAHAIVEREILLTVDGGSVELTGPDVSVLLNLLRSWAPANRLGMPLIGEPVPPPGMWPPE
jgi:hypothetical protein